jgi:hypothetical protein
MIRPTDLVRGRAWRGPDPERRFAWLAAAAGANRADGADGAAAIAARGLDRRGTGLGGALHDLLGGGTKREPSRGGAYGESSADRSSIARVSAYFPDGAGTSGISPVAYGAGGTCTGKPLVS